MSTGASPKRRRLEVEDIGDVTFVRFTDSKILDEANVQVIGDQLFSLVDNHHRKNLLLDFSRVEYMTSAFLGKLVTLNKKVQQAGGRLALCNIAHKEIFDIFVITGLKRLFNIYRDEQEALQSF
ncbi:hypothetical protein HRbin36_00883 [bacterium HR36]|nr:hypothetical protein HRbin36_00883 [bacterium HR36]